MTVPSAPSPPPPQKDSRERGARAARAIKAKLLQSEGAGSGPAPPPIYAPAQRARTASEPTPGESYRYRITPEAVFFVAVYFRCHNTRYIKILQAEAEKYERKKNEAARAAPAPLTKSIAVFLFRLWRDGESLL
ncbi:hypothetical protein EVAR_66128_1 [Eumeta japonica]|uniref:Uncharacterized protein n=1 Tax=Eumeta variegata TaxID=151549 RepID=A0A4C1ZWD6_EUMVA|nr:hypothetical protein EVAR_66128_1 [Eumeta japonica]